MKQYNKEKNCYSSQNCGNYNNYIRNANYKSDPFEGEEFDDINKLGTELGNELTFSSYYGKTKVSNDTKTHKKTKSNK